jgi:hypothetical protein
MKRALITGCYSDRQASWPVAVRLYLPQEWALVSCPIHTVVVAASLDRDGMQLRGRNCTTYYRHDPK